MSAAEPAALYSPFEWVWAACASGDLSLLRAAPPSFDVNGTHPSHGTVLTAFLQSMLNIEGRFGTDSGENLALDLVEWLGARGVRPDTPVPTADLAIKGIFRDWHFAGSTTAIEVVITIRNDLMKMRFEKEEELLMDHVKLMNQIVDRYAELVTRNPLPSAPRLSVPEAVVDVWEQSLMDTESMDVCLVSPDGRTLAHAAVLSRASPVVSAMLSGSTWRESQPTPGDAGLREVPVDEPAAVAALMLRLLYTGCLPPEPEPDSKAVPSALLMGSAVVVGASFRSNSAKGVLLPRGLRGEVARLDEQGDSLIKFEGLRARQWVTKRNFCRLRLFPVSESSTLLQDLAAALRLAHRLQLSAGFVEALAERLERGLCEASFVPVVEAAALDMSPRLLAACRSLAQSAPAIRSKYHASELSPAAMEALRPVLGPPEPDAEPADPEVVAPATKRQREAL